MITKRIWNTEYRLEIFQDECADDPRNWREDSYLCIREHRDYMFPNEIDFDFMWLDNMDMLSDEELSLSNDERWRLINKRHKEKYIELTKIEAEEIEKAFNNL